jgi:hypothetical protein
MAYDYTQEKTPIFTGINDNPQPATQNGGSNSSDLIAKVNKTLDELNNDLGNLESSINSLQTPSVGTNNLTFDANNRNDLSDYFNGNDLYLFIWHLPEGASYLNYDFNAEEFKTVNGDGNNRFFFSSNISNDLSTVDAVEIAESDLSANSIDITAYVNGKGNGTYIFIPYELVSSGSGGNNIELPTASSSIILAPQNTLVGVEIVTLIPNSFVSYRDTTANNTYTPDNGIQGLRVTDSNNFQGTLQLQSS